MIIEKFTTLFEGIVWKIISNDNQNIIAIEIRNTALRNTAFFVIDIENYNIITKDVQINEPWWLGMEAVSDKYLYLHHYDQQLYAQHKGIICISLHEQTIKWSLQNLTYFQLQNDIIIAKNKDKFCKIDTEYGNILNENIEKVETTNDNKNEIIKIQEDDEMFIKIQDFILKKLDVKAIKLMEYADINTKIIISFYYLNEFDSLTNELVIFDNYDSKILFSITLSDNLEGVGTNTFCVLRNKLVYCKNKNTLSIYEI